MPRKNREWHELRPHSAGRVHDLIIEDMRSIARFYNIPFTMTTTKDQLARLIADEINSRGFSDSNTLLSQSDRNLESTSNLLEDFPDMFESLKKHWGKDSIVPVLSDSEISPTMENWQYCWNRYGYWIGALVVANQRVMKLDAQIAYLASTFGAELTPEMIFNGIEKSIIGYEASHKQWKFRSMIMQLAKATTLSQLAHALWVEVSQLFPDSSLRKLEAIALEAHRRKQHERESSDTKGA